MLGSTPYAQAGQKPGPWHYRSIPCVDTTVTSVEPRLTTDGRTTFTARDFDASGVEVVFATTLGSDPAQKPAPVVVIHYEGTAGNDVMRREHPGDRVQVCFLGGPAPSETCDPDTDPRERQYRVYDYRQHAAYTGMNSEHGCGGA
ncbi:MAG TPA: hypothetical protein VMD91_06280 [Candidatus Sulfotelmatobacter sp.]|nr:hypothetical protein [Candidatus Sulfotelmatobacter sp.]